MKLPKELSAILNAYVNLAKKLGKFPTLIEFGASVSERQVRKHFGSYSNLKKLALETHPEFGFPVLNKEPKILIFDIETMYMTADVWGLFDQNISLGQLVDDGCIIAWAAKWHGDPASKVMYMDQRKAKNLKDNKAMIKTLRDLLDQADIVVSQNGIRFDSKKVNTEIEIWELDPPSSYRHHDLLRIAKKYLNLPSYKLEYMSNKYNKKYKKLKHKKFPGHELWRECKSGNLAAWKEMQEYNIYDVLATEELYNRFKKWFFRKYS